jgi:hypothetical protein
VRRGNKALRLPAAAGAGRHSSPSGQQLGRPPQATERMALRTRFSETGRGMPSHSIWPPQASGALAGQSGETGQSVSNCCRTGAAGTTRKRPVVNAHPENRDRIIAALVEARLLAYREQ